MKRKKKNDNRLLSVLTIGLLILGVVVSVSTHNALYGVFSWLGICFLTIFLYNKSEYSKVRKKGILINAYVTDCEKGDASGPNEKDQYYILKCEAEDEAVYGTAEVYSEKYVPIGRRVVLFYSRSMNWVCLAEELKETKTDIVTLAASIICFTVAVGGYIFLNYGMEFFSKENVIRIVVFVFSLAFIVMGTIFLWIGRKAKMQMLDNHRYAAKLVNYRKGSGGNLFPVWRYYYNGKSVEYESKTEKKIWQKIGRKSDVFVSEEGEVFEKSEIADVYGYSIIYLVAGIILAVLAFVFDFKQEVK